MGNISLKHWIIAGALSGVIIGFLVFLLFAFPLFSSGINIILKNISSLLSFIMAILYLLFLTVFSNIFLGVITGLILFYMYTKLPLNRRLSMCLLISVIAITLMIFAFAFSFLAYLIPFNFIALFHVMMWGYAGEIFGVDLPYMYIPTLLIGIAFGFLINYFINRMERKISK